ncbi:hypothetical protein N658DRAFT_486309 [Parathielavia hyrcaniae]|uniref:Uncharacterized protein n=1 Tax=Parathielavia hyrcaniae TaxID=113614 RepID=A0AAN6T262_9PEZI|nr:hypothetical protein N658DRAFT_486309 [Parathielavia hyrcaniae]
MALASLQRDVEWAREDIYGVLTTLSWLASEDRKAKTLPSGSGDEITVTALGSIDDVKALRELIDAGADAKCRDASGCTPLHLQALTGGEDLWSRFTVLLDAGADATVRTNSGDSVIDVLRPAISTSRARGTVSDVEDFLLRHGKKLGINFVASQ